MTVISPISLEEIALLRGKLETTERSLAQAQARIAQLLEVTKQSRDMLMNAGLTQCAAAIDAALAAEKEGTK